MGVVIARWDGMSTDDDVYSVFLLQKLVEIIDMRTWRITHNHARGKVDDLKTILLHLPDAILHISTRAPSTCCISHEFHFLISVETEGSFTVPQCS